jgi:hypothetical protein
MSYRFTFHDQLFIFLDLSFHYVFIVKMQIIIYPCALILEDVVFSYATFITTETKYKTHFSIPPWIILKLVGFFTWLIIFQ